MPPRIASSRGHPRGRGSGRGVGAPRGGIPAGLPSIVDEIRTVGVRRPGFGTAGRAFSADVNAYVVEVPNRMIYHYDNITPKESAPVNLTIIQALQLSAPQIFTRLPVYDGKKNLFTTYKLPLNSPVSEEFDVTLSQVLPNQRPRVYKVRVSEAQEINLEALDRFVHGKQSQDNTVLTGIMALNIVVRMAPIMEGYPFNIRSFFTEAGARDIGGGLVLWRGFFQSVRPAMGRMLVNIDISTGLMYKPGSLMSLCLEHLGRPPGAFRDLASGRLPNSQRLLLYDFLARARIIIRPTGSARTIYNFNPGSARELTLSGTTTTVADYYLQHWNLRLEYPNNICVEIGGSDKKLYVPIELCMVPRGQLTKKPIPSEKMPLALDFSTSKPAQRLASIKSGLETLSYTESTPQQEQQNNNTRYLNEFGIDIEAGGGKPMAVQARIISPPRLMYSPQSKKRDAVPSNGSWNMVDKRFIQPATVKRWAIIIYEGKGRFRDQSIDGTIKGFLTACKTLGVNIADPEPYVKYENGQGDIDKQLTDAVHQIMQAKKEPPNLFIVILPNNAGDIYTKVKHFGDIKTGIATQCLRSQKCDRGTSQYWNNVLLKVNVKLGGINMIPDQASASVSPLTDPNNPTIVMGADLMDPPPKVHDKPSFSALVSSVDLHAAKYIASIRVQPTREQIIVDMYEMAKRALSEYMDYGRNKEKRKVVAPTRIIFYRDGVSEGEYQAVLDNELKQLKKACEDLGIKPKITFIVVGKRHHIRFFPQKPQDGDNKSGNCFAGTIVDRDICHPTDFDYYLLSHGGLLGTSRPAHYFVLYDDYGFNADSLQALSFALCHVYARATRSVSIPAPVYYADIVCSRARFHFDPTGAHAHALSETGSQSQGDKDAMLKGFKLDFKQVNDNQARRMYFM